MKCDITAKRGNIAAWPEGQAKAMFKHIEQLTAQTRRRVEHVFHIIKDRCHYRKLRYQGLKKKDVQHERPFALAKVIIAKQARLAV